LENPVLFGYLSAFVTIVLAIALSDMLVSLHRLLVARSRVQWSIIPLAIAFFVFLGLLSEFFSVWHYANVKAVSFAFLVFLVCVSSVAAMAAFVSLPDDVPPEGLSLWRSYLARRAQLWVLIWLSWLGDVSRQLDFRELSMTSLSPGVFVPAFAVTAVSIALVWRSERWVHGLGAASIFAAVVPNFAGWNIG